MRWEEKEKRARIRQRRYRQLRVQGRGRGWVLLKVWTGQDWADPHAHTPHAPPSTRIPKPANRQPPPHAHRIMIPRVPCTAATHPLHRMA